MRVNSKEITYTGDTSAYLVAGRKLIGDFTDNSGFDEFCDWLDDIAAGLGQPLVVIPAGNFRGTGLTMSEAGTLSCAVGLLVASTDTLHVSSASDKDLVSAVARAEALPWDRIAELISSSRGDEPKTLSGESVLYAVATGPLAGLMVGYGALVALRPEDEEWDSDIDEKQEFLDDPASVAAIVPGLTLMQRNLMDQTPQPNAVYGVEVTRAYYAGLRPVPVDLSAEAHANRVAALGELSAESAYHLMAHYD